MTLVLHQRDPGFNAAFDALVETRRDAPVDVGAAVGAILAEVRERGDAALRHYTERFDGPLPSGWRLRIDEAEIDRAVAAVDPADHAALAFAARRIRAFHEAQLPRDLLRRDELGVELAMRFRPIDAVGLYVPGGLAAYPSSVLMNAIPAQVAGCRRLVMAVPTPGGAVAPLVLAAARLLAIDEVYRVGGAQAIGALAFGTASIPAVDKIVGPGNAYVAEAKRQVFGHVGIDMIAGPSEIVVMADDTAPAAWIAADLLSQAEHDPVAQSILVTDSIALAQAVMAEVDRQLERLERRQVAAASWQQHGAVIVVDDMVAAVPLIDRLAPEHLEIITRDPEPLVAAIRHAGSIFVGAYTPEVIGDYVGGPNHVLPTGRSARFASGLGVLDFMKRTTVLRCPATAFPEIGPAAERLANAEGLGAHAAAIACRLDRG
ncbi:MAG: histidinol dehydrogenase [Geminicoccaceae bacterium]|nr:MAG: histidinol dehydrogenase [Geminicoccaceae bacterium]